jgi:hypothetical protein
MPEKNKKRKRVREKKIRYERPELLEMMELPVRGACSDGSTDFSCENGPCATFCSTGSAA